MSALVWVALGRIIAFSIAGAAAAYVWSRLRAHRTDAETRARLMKIAKRAGLQIVETWPLSRLAFETQNAVLAKATRADVSAVLKQLRTVGDSDG